MNKYFYLLLGVGTGLLGIGLQHYNPLEPQMCSHMCPIVLGGFMFFLSLLILVIGRSK